MWLRRRIVERMLVDVVAARCLGQRIFDDLGQHRAGTVSHQHDPVGEVDRFVDVVRDHEHSLAGLLADAADLVLQGPARQRIERGERFVHQHDLRFIDSARAMPTRCFMPPDNSAGRLCSAPLRPTRSM